MCEIKWIERVAKWISDLFCAIGAHDWRDGPGYPCIQCGKEDDFWS